MQFGIPPKSMTPDNPSPDAQGDAKPGQPGIQPQTPRIEPQAGVANRPAAPQPRRPREPGAPAPAPGPKPRAKRLIALRLGILAIAVVITFLSLGFLNIFGRMFARILIAHLPIESIRIKAATPPPPPALAPVYTNPNSVVPMPTPGAKFLDGSLPAVSPAPASTPQITPISIPTPVHGGGRG